MKKEQIKKDPIRDNIINSYNYIANNQKMFLFITFAFIALLVVLVFFNNNQSSKSYDSSKLSGTAQYLYVLSEKNDLSEIKEESMKKFNEILSGSYDSESVNQAIIYKMLENIDDIDSISSTYEFDSDNDFLNAMYYTYLGNYYYDINLFDKAIESYKLALNSYDEYKDILIDVKLSLLKSYLEINDLSSASNVYNSIDQSLLSSASEDRLNIFYSQYKTKLK